MAVPKETIWDLDPHGRAKHEILRRYLEAWFPILSSYKSRIVYIDGFCGPGKYKGGEIGSPLIALEAARQSALKGQIVFYFIDERPDRIEHLKGELSAIKVPENFEIHCEIGRFDEKLPSLQARIEAERTPAFAFIDPFGFSGIPFALVAQFLGSPSCEVFITFMVDAINRWLEHPNPEIGHHIGDVFGTPEAVEVAKGVGNRVTNLRLLYQTKLQSVARFVRYFEMRDPQDRTQYYLFFASNNRLGHLKMKEAMWKVSPEGEFRFSDATDPNQLVLFETDPTTGLKDTLQTHFRLGEVTGGEIKQFVEDNTPFLGKHKTIALEQLEAAKKIVVKPIKLNGTKRRATTYPEDAIVRFLQ